MKKIVIYSHKSDKPFKLKNGDVYDSYLEVYDDNKLLKKFYNVNVDSSLKYNQGKTEIENGVYAGIVGLHRNSYKAILLFDYNALNLVDNWKQFFTNWEKYGNYRVLKTIYPNPANGNRKIAIGINIHKGGDDWDYSAGCITLHKSVYDDFINIFVMNEKVIIEKI